MAVAGRHHSNQYGDFKRKPCHGDIIESQPPNEGWQISPWRRTRSCGYGGCGSCKAAISRLTSGGTVAAALRQEPRQIQSIASKYSSTFALNIPNQVHVGDVVGDVEARPFASKNLNIPNHIPLCPPPEASPEASEASSEASEASYQVLEASTEEPEAGS